MIVVTFVVAVLAVAGALNLVFHYGAVGLAVALAVALASSSVAWRKSDAAILAVTRARPADAVEFARLHNLVEGLALASGVPKPRLYVIDDDARNAFATGRDPHHAAVVVTTGLLGTFTRVELEAVLAHEISRVRSHDTSVTTLVVTLVAGIVVLGDLALNRRWPARPRPGGGGEGPRSGVALGSPLVVLGLGLLVLAPLVGRAVSLVVGRHREMDADGAGVSLTRYPPGLVAALEKLTGDAAAVTSASRATAHLWIASPLARTPSGGLEAWLDRRFDTHLPLEERIAALREL